MHVARLIEEEGLMESFYEIIIVSNTRITVIKYRHNIFEEQLHLVVRNFTD